MVCWHWQGREAGGGRCDGEIDAVNLPALRQLLRDQGVRLYRQRRVYARLQRPTRQVVWLTRQLASLLLAGIPLVSALRGLADEPAYLAMRPMLKMLCRQLESGQSLSQAVALHSSYFSAGFCLALAAGEQSGMLDTVLARLALDGEKRQRLRIRVRSALMYPLTILLMALMVTALMLLTVIPAFAQAFATAGQALPRATRWVIALSDNLRTQGPVLLVGMCLLLLAVQCGWRRYPGWRLATDRLVLRLPCVGVLWQQLALVRWSRTLSMLLAAGVPLLNALQSAGQVAGNRVYLAASCQVATLIQQGCGLTAAMRQCACFPALLLQLAAVGEASGAMDQMFERAARYYEEQVDDSLQLLSSVLGPLAMALLGGLCAALIWVLYLPIFQLGQVLG